MWVGRGGQMLMFADKVGGWVWPNADVHKSKKKKYPRKKAFLCKHRNIGTDPFNSSSN
jgi:hypothetical protein